MTLADRIVVLNSGRIEQVGTPMELYENPANLFVARFIGSPAMNLFPARVVADAALQLAAGAKPAAVRVGAAADTKVTLGVRSEHLAITSSEQAMLQAKLVAMERLGSENIACLEAAESPDPVAVSVPHTTVPRVGEMLPIGLSGGATHVFGEDGNRI